MSAPQTGDRVMVTDYSGVEWPATAVEEVSVATGKGGGWPKIEVLIDPSEQYPHADGRSIPWPLDSVRLNEETPRHDEGGGASGPDYAPGRGCEERTP